MIELLLHDLCTGVGSTCMLDGKLCARCGAIIQRPGYVWGRLDRSFCRACGDDLLTHPDVLETWRALAALRA